MDGFSREAVFIQYAPRPTRSANARPGETQMCTRYSCSSLCCASRAGAQRSALMTDSVGPIADLTIEFHIAGGVV